MQSLLQTPRLLDFCSSFACALETDGLWVIDTVVDPALGDLYAAKSP